MSQSPSKKRVLVTGATGLVGTELCVALLEKNWEIVVLGRSSEERFRRHFTLPCEYYQWEEPTLTAPPKEALNVTHVINLAGEPIAARRWTQIQKSKLRNSRILLTQNLVKALLVHTPGLVAFISTSAIGYYGEQSKPIPESSPPDAEFLGTLCRDWELAANQAPGRKVIIRIGIVLALEGGVLGKTVPLFERGIGGDLSNGKQWMSWIHIQDLVSIFLRSLEDSKVDGAYNGVAPNPVTNHQFTKALAYALRVRTFLPVPALALRIFLGEMAQIALVSQRVKSEGLEKLGFLFKFNTIESALDDLFGWKTSRHDRIFQTRQWINQPRSVIFEFFSNARNLEILTPAFLNFRILKISTPEIKTGTLIDYKLRIHRLPVRWRTQILDWSPISKFRDTQLKGPYKKWDHTHLFADLAQGTLMTDRVIYRLPLAGFGGNLASCFILKDIMQIFKFRKEKIHSLFVKSPSL